jgi:hypothetical protein
MDETQLWDRAIKVAFIGEGTLDGKSVNDAQHVSAFITDVLAKGAHPDHPAVQAMIARLAQLAGVIEGLSEELTRQMTLHYVQLETSGLPSSA